MTNNIPQNIPIFPDDLLRNYSQHVNDIINEMYNIENNITDNYYYREGQDEEEKIDKKYFIGSSVYFNTTGNLIASCIKPTTFFTHAYDLVVLYLKVSSVYYIETPNIDIIQLSIIGDYYIAIKKTHWLRLVQKHWKNVFQKRKNIIRKRCLPQNLNYWLVNGGFPKGLTRLPGLNGLLGCYCK